MQLKLWFETSRKKRHKKQRKIEQKKYEAQTQDNNSAAKLKTMRSEWKRGLNNARLFGKQLWRVWQNGCTKRYKTRNDLETAALSKSLSRIKWRKTNWSKNWQITWLHVKAENKIWYTPMHQNIKKVVKLVNTSEQRWLKKLQNIANS